MTTLRPAPFPPLSESEYYRIQAVRLEFAPSIQQATVFGGKGHFRAVWASRLAMSGIADALERVSRHKGVLGLIIAGFDGSIHKSTLDEQLTQEYSSRLPQLTALARNIVRELEPQDDLEFLRVRSGKQEVLIAPRADYVLIVIQEAS